MSFKNAIKLLISRFGLVWVLLLYLIIFCVIIASLGIWFIIPVVKSFNEAGIILQIQTLFGSIVGGESINVWFTNINQIGDSVKNLLKTDLSTLLNSTLFFILIVGVAYRFIIGLYEIPLVSIIESNMSSNANLSFTGKFISKLGQSSRFVLCKMLYTVLFDSVFAIIVGLMFNLFAVKYLSIFAPFIIMITVIGLLGFRYSLIAMWSPSIVVGNSKIFKAFGFSVKNCFKNFGKVFSSFIVAWTLLIAFNILVGIFTFGAGLLATIPISMLFISFLNMTVYYGKTGKRYYIDETVITPPVINE